MNLCACGCGQIPSLGKRFVLHHHWRKKIVQPPSLDALTLQQAAPILQAIIGPQAPEPLKVGDVIPILELKGPTIIESVEVRGTNIHVETNIGPPPHPLPFDHGRFRIAEEQPGTDRTQPWRLTYCLECREPTWSHDNTSKTKDEKLCESCAWTLVTELSETRVQKENRTQRGNYDPFQ